MGQSVPSSSYTEKRKKTFLILVYDFIIVNFKSLFRVYFCIFARCLWRTKFHVNIIFKNGIFHQSFRTYAAGEFQRTAKILEFF